MREHTKYDNPETRIFLKELLELAEKSKSVASFFDTFLDPHLTNVVVQPEALIKKLESFNVVVSDINKNIKKEIAKLQL